jgi:type I restriction enzyme, S subunit
MIDGLKPYAEYKESGLPWLDAVPEHWEMVPNRALMTDQRQVVGENAADYMLLSLTLRGIIPRNMENPKGKFPAQFNTYKVVRPDDIVFCLFDIDETPRGVGLSNLKGMITGAYDVFSPRWGINPGFLSHYYLFVDEGKLMKPLYTGLRKTIQRGVFTSLKAPCPPSDEQAAIVRFLDHANLKIDRLISAKRMLIALLGEQKQAIIQRAVTCGLNPNVPLKPTGIPWLGDIPEHWKVPKVKQCARKISKGTTPSTEGRKILEFGPVRFLKAENIRESRITNKPLCFIDEETNRVIRRSQLAENDILFVIAGATFGKTALVSRDILPGNTNQAVAFIRPNKLVVPMFLELWLQSPQIKELIWLNAVQSAQPNLSMADLGNFVCIVPPQDEQTQILEFVGTATKPMSDAIARTEHEIALMLEYRTRLTADIVTGKLDVREAAAKLPDLPTDTDCSSDAKTQDEELFEEPESREE